MKGDQETVGVVGYIFSNDMQKVVLIEKDKPDWQAGKWNGVGGKMNDVDGGFPSHTMSRECLEETGVSIAPEDWIEVQIERFPNYTLHVFYTVGDYAVKKNEDEEPLYFYLKTINKSQDYLVDGVMKHIDNCLFMMT